MERGPEVPAVELTTATDEQLAADFAAGSDAAFEALYRRYATPIHDFLRWTVRDPDVAQDLAQSTFVAAYERRDSLRDPAAIRGWLFRIAHNLAMNHLTRTRRTDELSEDALLASPEPGPAELADRAAAVELVWDAAASLEPRQFAVLDLSLRKGLSSREIADVLDLEPAAASLAMHRAREALGNAVRFMVVARRRRHCARLAELVPEGVRRLTPEQRATVDRHMRRCPDCQRMALMLTAPDELFAAAPLAPLPIALRHLPPLTGHQPMTTQGWARARHLLRTPAGIGSAVVVAAGVTATFIALAVHQGAPVTHGSPERPGRSTSASQSAAQSHSAPSGSGSFHAANLSTVPAGSVFTDASCPTSTRCYAVANSPSGGVVATTSDGGSTWSDSTVPGAGALAAIDCVGDASCVVGGPPGGGARAVVFTSTDAGATWSPASAPTTAIITVIRCPDSQDCLAIGEDPSGQAASVIASTDGGRTWSARSVPAGSNGNYLAGARCLDAAHCWVVGSGIWFTPDLGTTWQDQTPPAPTCSPGTICGPPMHTLTDVVFTTPSDGIVVGYIPGGGYGQTENASYVGTTSDGGSTWTDEPQSATKVLPKAVRIVCSTSSCLTLAQTFTLSELVRSSDRGANWQPEQRVKTLLDALACSPDRQLCVAAGGDRGAGALLTSTGF